MTIAIPIYKVQNKLCIPTRYFSKVILSFVNSRILFHYTNLYACALVHSVKHFAVMSEIDLDCLILLLNNIVETKKVLAIILHENKKHKDS